MRIVTITVHRDPDSGWWADTDELPGYFVADQDLDEMRRLAREGLAEFLGEPVVLKERLPGGGDVIQLHAPVLNHGFGSPVDLRPRALDARRSAVNA